MKNLKLTSLICGSVLSLAGTSLLAQQSSPGQSSSTEAQSRAQSSTFRESTSGSFGSASMQSGSNVRLSQLMNSTVQSQEGKTLGHIRDLTVNPRSGRIEFAILSLSSAGGAADTSTSGRETMPSSRSTVSGLPSSTAGATTTGKLIPVPWQLFSQSMTGSQAGVTTAGSTATQHNLVLNLDEAKLRTAPSFDANNWNDLQSGNLDQRVHSFFNVDRTSAIGTPGSSISGQGTQGYQGSQGAQGSTQQHGSDQHDSGSQQHDAQDSHDRSSDSDDR